MAAADALAESVYADVDRAIQVIVSNPASARNEASKVRAIIAASISSQKLTPLMPYQLRIGEGIACGIDLVANWVNKATVVTA